uniref:Ribosomal protein L19 n=1 Tax=Parastrongyloides trichosuri TaxID=131310 RepID=A0A0N4ZYA0_PARTI
MSNLSLQKRLAASVLKCGKGRVWLDPNEASEISSANSRANVRRLVKDGLVIKKPIVVHSRFRARKYQEARRKGRHCGLGKRVGTANARMPGKILWIRRIRVLRHLLKKYRDAGRIDKHLYQELYLRAKGNAFKNKRNLQEYIFKKKAENVRAKQLMYVFTNIVRIIIFNLMSTCHSRAPCSSSVCGGGFNSIVPLRSVEYKVGLCGFRKECPVLAYDQVEAAKAKAKESRKRREEKMVQKRQAVIRRVSETEKESKSKK